MMLYGTCFLVVLFSSFSCISAAAKKRNPSPESDVVMYPGPLKETKPEYGPVGSVPKECQGKTYCTVKPPDYPEERYNKLFQGYKPPVDAAPPQPVLSPTLVNRQGDPDELDNCQSVVTYEPLYKVRSKRLDDWVTVLQAPRAGYEQRVRLETCTNPNARCFTALPQTDEYTTFCKQKYNTWEVMVEINGTMVKETTDLPICCSCHYKTVDLASRFGKPKEMSAAKPKN
ncbi:hypothetical protein JYU34_006415 [Plutella xylostella]|uniref:Spaetzle domain-containing protein n=1 Tax=Plutella xylostella TaxID=51655 RepID=A0ABQ7QS03_PLUXY|nr:hypothetical protein JYU34_006415 [Plutella xylostella]